MTNRSGARRRMITAGAAIAVALTMLGTPSVAPAAGTPPVGPGDERRADERGADERRAEEPYIVAAVGDIACAPTEVPTETTCRQADTAELAQSLEPDRVLALGDLQYESGELASFQAAYELTWGALKSITLPIPGNHEYRTEDASGYYTYFSGQQPGAPGYYVRRLGAWRVYALNSMCYEIDCDAQERWFRDALKSDPGCSLVMWHMPRFASNAVPGTTPAMRKFFRLAYEGGVELLLSGHEHNYQRFRPMDPDGRGRPAKGVTQYIAGGGGKSIVVPNTRAAGTRSQINEYGVLRLALRDGSYRSAFRGIDGPPQDVTVGTCHAPPA